MATTVPFGAHLEMLWQSAGQNVVMRNGLWFTKDTVFTTADLIDLMDAANTSAVDNLLPVMNNATLLVGSRARIVSTDPWGFTVEDILATPLAGGVAGDAFPYQVSATVAFLAAPGEDVREGYVRHTGISESQATGNSLTPTAITDIGGAWLSFVQDIEGAVATAQHVVVSLFEGYTLQPAAPDGTRKKTPTPRVVGLLSGVQDYIARRPLGRAVSRAGLRA